MPSDNGSLSHPSPPPSAGTLWDLPFRPEDARLVVIPVPWEVTVTFRPGTAGGPEGILQASPHVDLYDALYPEAWKKGVAMLPVPGDLKEKGQYLRRLAESVVEDWQDGPLSPRNRALQDEVNQGCREMVRWVRARSAEVLQAGRLPAVLGGDHSVPLGLIQALADQDYDFGILQIDAHADLRESYQGFDFSHASIMFNALNCSRVRRLVQVGVRDYCLEEVERVARESGRVVLVAGRSLWRRCLEGATWAELCAEILVDLPDSVYISFDIDGLEPSLCAGTGTPAPGGLMFEQALYLIDAVVASGRRIVAFDLCEVVPGRDLSDAYIGARLLYRLSCAALESEGDWL